MNIRDGARKYAEKRQAEEAGESNGFIFNDQGRAMVKGKDGKWEDRSIETLHAAVVECCGAWGLYEQTDFITQQVKGCEEAGEGCKSVNKGRVEALKDDVGDMLVCIINMCRLDSTEGFIEDWHRAKSKIFYSGDNPEKYQMRKIVNLMSSDFIDVGRTLRAIKGLCELYGIDPVECLGIAYDVIIERDGKMINGTFVKSEDL